MCMTMDRRLQLRLDDERYREVPALAQQRGTSVAAVIREAIDRDLRSPDDRPPAAVRRVLDAKPMQVPDVAELLKELEAVRGRRA